MPRVRKSNVDDKPKGRMTAYAFFVQTCRAEHKKAHPNENVNFADFSRQCSERWKTMSDKEKKKFNDLAETDKSRYTSEMKDFVPSAGVATGRRQRRPRGSKPPKDPNKPKRALSAFFYYANVERSNVRAANPDFSVGEVAKELGRQWNELTDGQKAPFEKQASDDRARYDKDMIVYKAGGIVPPPKKMKSSNGHAVAAPKEKSESEGDDDEEDAEEAEDDNDDNDDDDDDDEDDDE